MEGSEELALEGGKEEESLRHSWISWTLPIKLLPIQGCVASVPQFLPQ